MWDDIVNNKNFMYECLKEYGLRIIEVMEMNELFIFGGNVLNIGLIINFFLKVVVEVICVVDRKKIIFCFIGELFE